MVTGVALRDIDRDAAVRELGGHARRAVRGWVALGSRGGFAIAFDLLGDRTQAEDAVQDALEKTLAGFHRVRDPQALPAWFQRTLVNGCIGILRRRPIAVAFATLVGARGEPTPRSRRATPTPHFGPPRSPGCPRGRSPPSSCATGTTSASTRSPSR